MLGSNAISNELPTVGEFYHGKSIFLTGAAGFVGSVLLEALLRCCRGINFIFILLRTKKSVQPEIRKEQIFNKKIFEKLKKENPKLLEKVCVISGDVSKPGLGINKNDEILLLGEVSIVFHCAAVVNLKKPLEFLLINNVLGLNTVIEFCRKMRKFEVLVYTSTAYSNCNHLNVLMREEVCRLPVHAGQFLDALKTENKVRLQELVAQCKPDWPNSYCFSKCLAENVIADTASDLPVAILRPSIVAGTWKHPIPGFTEENSAFMGISLGIGKGFIRVVNAVPNCEMNLVPVDIVANAHILAAWSVGSKRCTSPLVVNCTSTEKLSIKISEYCATITQLFLKFPLPESFQQPSYPIIVPFKYLYYIIAAYYHYLPATVLDVWSRILGKKPRFYSLHRFFDLLMESIIFFWFHTFEFERKNLEYLDSLIPAEERKDLSLDFRDASVLGIVLSFPEGSPFYDSKTDKKSPCERQKFQKKRHMIINCIHGIFLITCCLLIYWMFFSTGC